MSTTDIEHELIDESEIATPQGGLATWRASEGKIVTGREVEGTLIEREKIVGKLKRIGIYYGDSNDGKHYGKLEVDIETTTGNVRFGTSLTDAAGDTKSSVASNTFAEGLFEVGKDEQIIITATQSQKENKYGKKVTYVNIFHVDFMGGKPKARPTKRTQLTEAEKKESALSRWEKLVPQLKAHPAYAERPVSEDELENTHFGKLILLCNERGWPSPADEPKVWCEKVGALAKMSPLPESTREIDDDVWGQIKMVLEKRGEMPEWLAPYVKAEGPAVEAGDFAGI